MGTNRWPLNADRVAPDASKVACCLFRDLRRKSPTVQELAKELEWPKERVVAALRDLSAIGLRRAAYDLGFSEKIPASLCAFVGDYSPVAWLHT